MHNHLPKATPLGIERIFLVLLCVHVVAMLLHQRTALLWTPTAAWPDALLLLLGLASLTASLSRVLPLQNLLLASALVLFPSAILNWINNATGYPFGRISYSEGSRLVQWSLPWVWLMTILLCRSVARLLLVPWQRSRFYGFAVLALAPVVMFLFLVVLEVYMSQVRGYWSWEAGPGALWTRCLTQVLFAAGILILLTPILINKRFTAQPQLPATFAVWLGLNTVFVSGLFCAH